MLLKAVRGLRAFGSSGILRVALSAVYEPLAEIVGAMRRNQEGAFRR
jgi:hypothetical protein